MRARASLFGTTMFLTAAAIAASCSTSSDGDPTGTAGTGSQTTGGAGTTGSAGTGSSPGTAGTTGAGGTTGAAGTGSAAGTAGTTGTGGTTGAAGTGSSPTGSAGTGGGPFTIPTVTWPSDACKTMATTLVGQMTRAEKAAQMVMADNPSTALVTSRAPGAVFAPGGAVPPGGSGVNNWGAMIDGYNTAAAATRMKLPILYGADVVHGNNVATGTVIFPHNAGLGGTRDPQLVQEIGRVTAIEAAAAGITWTFAPVVSVSWDDRWGRVYESFSEDVEITKQLAAAITMGLQGPMGLGKGTAPSLIGCAKHWAGDGQATPMTSSKQSSGTGGAAVVDRGDIRIDEAAMRKYGIAPYLGALQAGLGSIMVSDARWNGASLTTSNRMTTEILKTELGFKGFVSTDWNAATESPGASIVAAINSGVDMLMHPAGWQGAIDTINNSAQIPDSRINDAATRIITVKCEAGLFNKKRDTTLASMVGSTAHRELGRRAVRQSMVLLKNEGAVLPLAKTAKVYVGGSGGNSLANQCGGWTISWQGSGGQTTGTTISAAVGKVATVVPTMAEADAIVVVLSEKPYAEFQGDTLSLNTLPAGDKALLDQAKATGKKTVAIVMSGRPVIITDQLTKAGAWIAAWLPGTEGTGVADVLFGDYKPTAKLSHSWPKSDAGTRINMGDAGYDPLFPLGHGLTY